MHNAGVTMHKYIYKSIICELFREEQVRQDQEREEIRSLEIERLKQIQEDQQRLEEERNRQQQQIRYTVRTTIVLLVSIRVSQEQ